MDFFPSTTWSPPSRNAFSTRITAMKSQRRDNESSWRHFPTIPNVTSSKYASENVEKDAPSSCRRDARKARDAKLFNARKQRQNLICSLVQCPIWGAAEDSFHFPRNFVFYEITRTGLHFHLGWVGWLISSEGISPWKRMKGKILFVNTGFLGKSVGVGGFRVDWVIDVEKMNEKIFIYDPLLQIWKKQFW